MEEIASSIYSDLEQKELRKRLRMVDLVLVDLDDCMYPGTTNLALLGNLFFILFRSREYKFFFRLISSLPILFWMKCLQLLGLGIDNPKLSLLFCKMINTTPFSYLQAAVQPIPSNSFPGTEETLNIFSQGAKIGLISLGLDIVLEEYKQQLGDGKPLIDFYNGTQVSRIKLIDKGEIAKRRIKEFNSKMPLVIGHNRDDLGMMKVAKKEGGLVLGFNPSTKVSSQCDIVVKAKDWQPLAKYLQISLNNRTDKWRAK